MKEFYITDDGIRLHAKLEKPAGQEKCPLIILIHGLTGHMEETHILAAKDVMLEEGYAVLRVDMYGHGNSEGEFKDHNLFKWMNNAMRITDYAKTLDFVTDLYLCGHSQGGLTAMLAAGMRPQAYKAIFPMSPAIVITDGARKGKMLGMTFDPDAMPEEVSFHSHTLSSNYLRAAMAIDVDHLIDCYTKPVYIIHGDQDEAVPLHYSITASKKYKNCELTILPDDDHCYRRHLDKAMEALRVFLKKEK